MADPPPELIGRTVRRGAARLRGLDAHRAPAGRAGAAAQPADGHAHRRGRPADRDLPGRRHDPTAAAAPGSVATTPMVEPREPNVTEPERTLILGWNWRGPAIVRELDALRRPGFAGRDRGRRGRRRRVARRRPPGLRNADGEFRAGDTTDRALLDALKVADVQPPDHPVLLGLLEPQLADARTLITLLHLRDIAAAAGHASRSSARCSTCGTARSPR